MALLPPGNGDTHMNDYWGSVIGGTVFIFAVLFIAWYGLFPYRK
jgi:hypothetical protein